MIGCLILSTSDSKIQLRFSCKSWLTVVVKLVVAWNDFVKQPFSAYSVPPLHGFEGEFSCLG